ncbi:MAG: sulfatase-like hydrolase/transferase, partial [Verrucomicrobiota bacterium]|nr:sulfatase-like hydrolase/transferase [Verrucomicrobiota bacterium]
MKWFFLVLPILLHSLAASTDHAPNILWIIAEDLSPFFGCYGDIVNQGHTPTVDQIAAQGVLFNRAYT